MLPVHETEVNPVGGYGFCKTGFSEIAKYDLIVKATLIVAGVRAPGCYRFASDGFDFDWVGAAAWSSEVLGRRPPQTFGLLDRLWQETVKFFSQISPC